MKRAWIASAVASVLFTAGMGIVGADAEDNTADSGVPYPGPGTQAVYAATPMGVGDDHGVKRLIINWGDPIAVYDDHYDERMAWPVDIEIEASGDHRLWAMYDTETGRPLYDGQETTREYRTGINGQQTGEGSLAFDLFHEIRGLCGLLDGPGLDASADQVELSGHCTRLDGNGTTTYERIDRLHYQHPTDERFQVAYRAGIPVPTSMTVPLSDMLLRIPHTEVVWRFHLQSWQNTQSYVPAPSLISSQEAPEQLPLTDWTLDDSGITDHPFPLRDAYAAAMEDTVAGEPSDVAQFLEEHPDAYLRSAWSNRVRDGSGNYQYNWFLTWTDGVDLISRQVSLKPGGAGGATSEEAPPTTEVSQWSPSDADDRPLPQAIPSTMPDPARVMELQRLFTDDTEYLNRYGFQIYGQSDGTTRALVAGGSFTFDYIGGDDPQSVVRSATEGTTAAYNQLMVKQDGSPIYTERAMYRTHPVLEPNADTASTPPDDGSAAGWTPPSLQATAGIGAIALLGGAATYASPALRVPALALFSRIRGDHLLEHPSRAAIMAMVEAEPGIHFQELLRRMNVGASTLQHHLQKLVQAKHVTVKVSPGYNCYFPRKVDRAVVAAAPFLRADGPRAILEAVVHGEDATVAAIARKTDLSTSTVSHHLKRMKEAGLVEGGGRDGFVATDLARRVM